MKFDQFGSSYQSGLAAMLAPVQAPALDAAPVQNAAASNGVEYYPMGDPRVSELFGGRPAASGMYVSAESAMRVAAVYACVNRIAGGISSMPCNVFERVWDADRRRYVRRQVDDAPLWWLLNEQPCAAWSGALHWERLMEHKLLRGDHFTEIRRKPKSGTVSELVPFPWSSVIPSPMSLEVGARLMYAVNDGMRTRGVDQDDMLHFPGFGFDGVRGRSVISQAARNAAGNAMAMDEFAGRFFANGSHPSIVLETDKRMAPEIVNELQSQYVRKYSGLANAHAIPMILTEGLKAKAVSVNADDAQLLDLHRFSVLEICRAFGVPPHMVGETSGATSWGSGIESMGRAFVTYTLAQHIQVVEQELNRKLFRTAARFVAFDRSALLEGDLAAQAVWNRAALGGPGTGKGWASVNDIRNKGNLPPLDGEDGIYSPPDKPTGPPSDKPPKEGA